MRRTLVYQLVVYRPIVLYPELKNFINLIIFQEGKVMYRPSVEQDVQLYFTITIL